MLFVLSGPSGVGKGTVADRLRRVDRGLWFSVSATTRPPRPGEVEGREYLFLDDATFEKWRQAGDFIESFDVFGHRYGTPRRPVEEHLGQGADVLLEIDVRGALAVREVYSDAVLIFLVPPDRDSQRARLVGRGANADDEIARRLEGAATEEAVGAAFDHRVVNDDLERAVGEVAAILASYRDARGV